MVLFDADGLIRRYQCAEDILKEFFELRLQYYGKRRDLLIKVRCFTADHAKRLALMRSTSLRTGVVCQSSA